MPQTTTLITFMIAALALLLIPGPAVFFITARSIDQGRVAGVVSALGVGLGNCVHVIGATLGLSALLASSATLFSVVKYFGAGYLVYLGVRRLLSTDEDPAMVLHRRGLRRTYAEGAIVAALNPKTAIFFVAFLPQFATVSADAPPVWQQTLLLGLVFVVMGTGTDSTYALLAGAASRWVKRRAASRERGGRAVGAERRLRRGGRLVSGGIFITLGVTTALTGARTE